MALAIVTVAGLSNPTRIPPPCFGPDYPASLNTKDFNTQYLEVRENGSDLVSQCCVHHCYRRRSDDISHSKGGWSAGAGTGRDFGVLALCGSLRHVARGAWYEKGYVSCCCRELVGVERSRGLVRVDQCAISLAE